MFRTIVVLSLLIFNYLETFCQQTDGFNVLLITVDDLNDWTEPGGGHPQTLTPNFSRFAEESITFTNAYANSPVCNPSRVSFLTGFRANSTGIFFNSPNKHVNESSQELRDSPPLTSAKTLPQYFSGHGYETISMGKVFHDPNSDTENWDQWQRTFGDYGKPDFERGKLANGIPKGLIRSNMDWAVTSIEKSETQDFITANWVSSRIQSLVNTSFLVATGIYRPHLKWYLPGEYFEKFPLDEIVLPSIDKTDLEDIDRPFPTATSRSFQVIDSLDMKDEAVRSYLASINYADEALGIILDGLEMSPQYNNTVVVIVGDHGWHLGEKLRYNKSTLWEEGTKTTFMIKIPGHPMSGQKIDVPVSLLDLYPTLVELCNLPPNSNLQGESILPIIDNPDQYANRLVYSTIGPENHSIRTKKWRYTRYRKGTEELYDHENDSLEHTNLIHDNAYSDNLAKLKFSMDSVLLKDKRPIQYSVSNHYFPGELQFENYDSGGEGLAFHDSDTINRGNDLRYEGEGYRFDGVDVFPSNDENGGFFVHMEASEWMEYTVHPNSLDAFQCTVRYRSPPDIESQLEIAIDGIVNDTIHLPGSNDTWSAAAGSILYQSIGEEPIVLSVRLLEGEVDLNYLETERKVVNKSPHTLLVNDKQDLDFLIREAIDSAEFRLEFSAIDPESDLLTYQVSWNGGDWLTRDNYLINQSLMDFSDTTFKIHVTVSDEEFSLVRDIQIHFMVEQVLAVDGSKKVVLYPNPVDEEIFIQGISRSEYVITNPAGQRVTSGIVNSYEAIDVKQLPPGLYIIKLQDSRYEQYIRFIKE